MPYALALGLTLLVEVPLCTAVLTRTSPVPAARALAAAVLVNLVTHPPLWWFLSTAGHDGAAPYLLLVLTAEAAVCLVEALLLRRWLRLSGVLPYATALTTNAASVLVGGLVLG
ncbi:hypothetical protein MTQ01_11795 [Streptomyces sp. XM4193]|uniref:hypothetical protein n=1 Tax=Streptomyces sp. XM4193 TaxID=2929782 RepID=UPI001FF8F057|nr:hypothetical protein [Streptomyces sp. XM4193]MCK1796686.1 hypothetical protein [Streptomyces sp. XM4193]